MREVLEYLFNSMVSSALWFLLGCAVGWVLKGYYETIDQDREANDQ